MNKFIHINSVDSMPTAIISYGQDNSYYTILWRYRDSDQARMANAMNNLDPASKELSCKQETSPKGTPYKLCHQVDDKGKSVYGVSFRKGETFIDSSLPFADSNQVPTDALNEFVDSFVKAPAPTTMATRA